MKRSGAWGAVANVLPIVGLITMLLILAVLQLRWSAKVSEAERGRLQQNLQRSAAGFQSAFATDLLGACQTLQSSEPRESGVLANHLFDRYMVWRRISRHAALISGLYIWRQSGQQSNVLLRLNPETHELEAAAWPDALRAMAARPGGFAKDAPYSSRIWRWDEEAAALVHPLYVPGPGKDPVHPRLFGYLFVVFNTQDFGQVYLPELGRRYFPLSNGFVFQLVTRQDGRQRVVYQSGKHVSAQVFPHADAVIPLLNESIRYQPSEPEQSSEASAPSNRVLLLAHGPARWQLVIRHRSGSVSAAVNSLRRRNLAVSMVVLLMLLVSLITILSATRRARRLAQLQMEFASGISHELRTPLAVIRSAADNLADGVISQPDRVREYGTLIHNESGRLSGMVDHILDFARLHASAPVYQLETVTVTDIFDQVLAGARASIQSAGVVLDVEVPDDLPTLSTDPAVLRQCLQNLISNAVKYGSDGRRIFIAASQTRRNGQHCVSIRVQDFGAGIAAEELPHIYEPFYRAPAARQSQIHGTGLGLSLTRKMMEGLGGRITVESSLGKGSTFTLHLPLAGSRDFPRPASELSNAG